MFISNNYLFSSYNIQTLLSTYLSKSPSVTPNIDIQEWNNIKSGLTYKVAKKYYYNADGKTSVIQTDNLIDVRV